MVDLEFAKTEILWILFSEGMHGLGLIMQNVSAVDNTKISQYTSRANLLSETRKQKKSNLS